MVAFQFSFMTAIKGWCFRTIMVGVVVFIEKLFSTYSTPTGTLLMLSKFVTRTMPHVPFISLFNLYSIRTIDFTVTFLFCIFPNFFSNAFPKS